MSDVDTPTLQQASKKRVDDQASGNSQSDLDASKNSLKMLYDLNFFQIAANQPSGCPLETNQAKMSPSHSEKALAKKSY